MNHLLNKNIILRIHPLRKYFEYLALEHKSGIRLHLSGSVKDKFCNSKFSKSKAATLYFKETVNSFLIGEQNLLAQDYLKRNLWPKKISLHYKSIPHDVFRIMLNQRIQKIIQFMALTGEYTATDITKQVNSLYKLRKPFSPQAISKYLYFFWNVLPSEDEEPFDLIRIVQFLTFDKHLSKVFAEHIEVAIGKQSPLEVAIRFGFNEMVTSQINDEVYRGFALTVARKNEAIMSNSIEEADIFSKIMIRDSQVLRNLGHKPKRKALRDSVKVIYDGED